MLSLKDSSYWKAIQKFVTQCGRMPSYGEIMELTGFRSRNAVYGLINRLIKNGFVFKDTKGKIISVKKLNALPLLGVVEAGWPSPAEEELIDTMTLDEYLIQNQEASYMLKVTGDSMIEAGIQPGDIVIVERTNSPCIGDIVIAEVDGDWTMKYLRKRGSKFYLEPANRKYEPIEAEQSLKITAVVKAVVRKY